MTLYIRYMLPTPLNRVVYCSRALFCKHARRRVKRKEDVWYCACSGLKINDRGCEQGTQHFVFGKEKEIYNGVCKMQRKKINRRTETVIGDCQSVIFHSYISSIRRFLIFSQTYFTVESDASIADRSRSMYSTLSSVMSDAFFSRWPAVEHEMASPTSPYNTFISRDLRP